MTRTPAGDECAPPSESSGHLGPSSRLLRRDRDRQPLATLGSPALQYIPPARRSHAGEEAVGSLAARVTRLKGSLHGVPAYPSQQMAAVNFSGRCGRCATLGPSCLGFRVLLALRPGGPRLSTALRRADLVSPLGQLTPPPLFVVSSAVAFAHGCRRTTILFAGTLRHSRLTSFGRRHPDRQTDAKLPGVSHRSIHGKQCPWPPRSYRTRDRDLLGAPATCPSSTPS